MSEQTVERTNKRKPERRKKTITIERKEQTNKKGKERTNIMIIYTMYLVEHGYQRVLPSTRLLIGLCTRPVTDRTHCIYHEHTSRFYFIISDKQTHEHMN